MKIFNKKESGFTLVELVVVVAVVGVLAVVATPKIVSVASNARVASLSGVVQSLTSANARNFAIREAEGSDGDAVTSCVTALNTVEAGALPTGYVLSSTDDTTAFVNNNDHITAASAGYTGMEDGVTYNCSISTVKVPKKTGVFIAVGSPATSADG